MKVDTSATVRVDLTLAPQDSKFLIEVSARPPALEKETSMTGDTVTGKELTDLPLNGSNSFSLAMTVAGVQCRNSGMNIFSIVPTISRTGMSLAGQIRYLIGANPASFLVGSREYYIAQRHSDRQISLGLKVN